MDFLFDNPLASMYGPYFLVFYIIFIFMTLVIFSILKNQLDKTRHYAMPPIPSQPDPFEIAFLRGGENELARSVVFSLTQKNLLKIINDGKTSRIYRTEAKLDKQNLSPIERTAHGWFGAARDAKEIFGPIGLAKSLRPYYETYEARLEQQHLIPDEEIKQKRNRIRKRAAFVVAGLGLYKISAALINGYTNIWGIIILGTIGLVVIMVSGKLPRQTRLGKAYLERLQIAFDRLRNTNQLISSNKTSGSPEEAFASFDPLLLSVGVFGGAVLAGTIYDDYNQAFQRAQSTAGVSGSCGSSCGSSSCSSGGDSSSSCSGGGDGGGGCGGGCGGCGGGCS